MASFQQWSLKISEMLENRVLSILSAGSYVFLPSMNCCCVFYLIVDCAVCWARNRMKENCTWDGWLAVSIMEILLWIVSENLLLCDCTHWLKHSCVCVCVCVCVCACVCVCVICFIEQVTLLVLFSLFWTLQDPSVIPSICRFG